MLGFRDSVVANRMLAQVDAAVGLLVFLLVSSRLPGSGGSPVLGSRRQS